MQSHPTLLHLGETLSLSLSLSLNIYIYIYDFFILNLIFFLHILLLSQNTCTVILLRLLMLSFLTFIFCHLFSSVLICTTVSQQNLNDNDINLSYGYTNDITFLFYYLSVTTCHLNIVMKM